ncbi:hypothetical protein FQZ97_578900 [compost metagenome]
MTAARTLLNLLSGSALVAASCHAIAGSLPAGLCELRPDKPGYQQRIYDTFKPQPNRGVTVVLMAIDCESLSAAENGRPDRPKMLFTDYRATSAGGVPAERPAALDFFEARYKNRPDYLGRDGYAVYIRQESERLSGASAYSSVDGTGRIYTLLEFNVPDAAQRAQRIVSEYARSR